MEHLGLNKIILLYLDIIMEVAELKLQLGLQVDKHLLVLLQELKNMMELIGVLVEHYL